MLARVILVLSALTIQPCGIAQEPDEWRKGASPDERELVDLLETLPNEYKAFHAEAAKITDRQEQWKFLEQRDPARQFVPKLLQFEQQHQGSEVGLMALRRLVFLGAGGGPVGNPRDLGRREALKRLPAYAGRPVLTAVLQHLDGGNFEPQALCLLRSLASDETADPTVREFSRLMLARIMLIARDLRPSFERSIRESPEGAPAPSVVERQQLEAQLELYPPASELQRWEDEAVLLLREVCRAQTGLRQPAVHNVEGKGIILRVDEDRTKQMPLISSLASGVLFKEEHLRVGKRAPDLNVKLVSEQDWSLAAQSGRVTIIQFSFKGCGPCERMYPDLREIQRMHGDRVSILSIMADLRVEDAREAVSSGKMTWNVHWDGSRGPLATRWGVDSFPTVYVVDGQGYVAAVGERGEPLKNRIASLLTQRDGGR